MGFFDFLSAGKTIAEPIEAIGNIIDACHTSDDEKEQAKQVMERIKQKPMLVQSQINAIQVQHRSLFVAGARPFIQWICGLGLGFSFIINPCIQWYTGQQGPKLPTEIMLELVIAMLGLGVMRTVEKIGRVTK